MFSTTFDWEAEHTGVTMIRTDELVHMDGEEEALSVAYRPILIELNGRLRERGSRMVSADGLDSEFVRNVVAILDETVWLVRDASSESVPAVAVDYGAAAEFDRTGQLRANQNVHPAEPLMAAEVLFDVALPILASNQQLLGGARSTPVEVARALHHAIWRRFPPGAIAYAENLRRRLSAAHQESRQRLSRELHDRVAHTIAAGIQRVELATMEDDLPPHLARPLSDAADILRAALIDVRDLAVQLRARVGEEAIDEALRRYAQSTPPPHPMIETHGERWRLRPWLGEELFAIVVEALRNAKEHSGGAIRVDVTWAPDKLTLSISDTGRGFNRADVRSNAIGLADMAERASAIGAGFHIDTEPTQGTTVTVTIPAERAL